jgi:drug/metabolite transporter (DMT)-like permease
MNARWVSLAVVVVAFACYHVAQRSMPDGLRPAPLFTLVYGAATMLMTVATIADPSSRSASITTSASHWAPWLLVASISGIELGVYAMYRSGWSVAAANTSTQAIVAVVLVVIGLLAFGEHLTLTRGVGLGLCVIGAGLVVAR